MSIWVVRFVTELERLGLQMDPAILADRGSELWKCHAGLDPENAALRELVHWPPAADGLQ